MDETVPASTLVAERPVMHLVNSADIPRLRSQPSQLRSFGTAPRLLGPFAAFVAALVFGARLGDAALAALALTVGLVIGDRRPSWQHLLPLAGRLVRLAGPALGLAIVLILDATGLIHSISTTLAAWVTLVSTAVWVLSGRLLRRAMYGHQVVRLAVIGSERAARSLKRELALAGLHGIEVVGRIATPGEPRSVTTEVPVLAGIDGIGAAVSHHGLDLLLMSSGTPRMAIFDEIARTCLALPVRLRELSSFYEDAFGHVAAAEINAAWFQYILHPNYRSDESLPSRVLDIVVATLMGLAALPLMIVLALLIRRDGGPVFFRQVRIGEQGKPFTIFKLRTMSPESSAEWATADDARVTAIGRVLRRTHLDELPQVLNVLRGEMSIVGPRPEQPGFVDQLERVIPFYQRRHLIKPGLTGWAQVRCGYAGSDVGSAWKVCHDLYYLKHRSFWMNLVILTETFRTLVADPQYTAEPSSVDFILAPIGTRVEGAPLSA